MTVTDLWPTFNIVRGTVADYMHSVCQGVIWQQPRSQALSSMRRPGGKTLVAAGHVSHLNVKLTLSFTYCRGSDFRKDYGKLGVLCTLFPDVPCLAMTATASHTDMQAIKDSLGLKKCRYIVANPDRKICLQESVSAWSRY